MKLGKRSLYFQIISVTVFIVLWETSVRLGWLNQNFVASPSEAFYTLFTILLSGSYARDFQATFTEILVAYGIALSIGIGVGLIVGTTRYLSEVFNPILMALFSLPKIILFPLFMLWFGVGIDSKITYASFAGFFPIVINTIAGVKDVNPYYVVAARSMGARNTQIYSKVIIPSLVPMLFSGLRIGLIIVGVSVIVAEEVVSPVGIGQVIVDLANKLQPNPVYAIIIMLSAIMILLNYSLLRIERWQYKHVA